MATSMSTRLPLEPDRRFVCPSRSRDEAVASIPEQLERGFTTICIKPSLFIDDPSEMRSFRDQVVERVSRGER